MADQDRDVTNTAGRGAEAWLGSPGGVTRRRFVRGGGAGLLSLTAAGTLLAACGGDGQSGEGDGTVGGTLDLYTWEGYDAAALTRPWRSENDVRVRASFISSQDDVQTRLKSPAGAGTDVSILSQWYIGYYKQLGLLSPITVDEVPTLADLYPRFAQAPWRDEDGTFNSVPFSFGWNGLAFSPERLGKTPDTWDVLFEPKLKDRVAVWDEPYGGIMLAAIVNGFDPNAITHAQLDVIKDWLGRLRPQVVVIPQSIGDYLTLLANGEVDAVYNAWCGAPTFTEGAAIDAVIPREGAIGWVDAMFVPPDSDNRETALAWCERLTEGKLAAKVLDELGGGATSPEVAELLQPETRELFPYDDLDELFDQVVFPTGLPRGESGDVTVEEALAAWQEFKAA